MAPAATSTAVLAMSSTELFLRENAAVIAVVVCGLLAYLVLRLAVKAATRLVLLALLAGAALFVVVQRDEIADCAKTCTCRIGGETVDVGICSDGLVDLGN